MPQSVVRVPREGQPLFNFISYGRKLPEQQLALSPADIAQIARTVSRVPEVMVKVSGGARDANGATAHLKYIDRHGKLAIETDEGQSLVGKGAATQLAADWHLELSRGQRRPAPAAGEKDSRPKVVHNIVLSMPAPTPPQAVLDAARRFARENFALQYRYAMVLHTDQHHPHVHLVVKAEHEYQPGKRLYVRKATLQQWREQFAACLRAEGVRANATPRFTRGQTPTGKKDPIHHRLRAIAVYRALPAREQAGREPPAPSTFMQSKVMAVARELQRGRLEPEAVRERLVDTRKALATGWLAAASALRQRGETALAGDVEAFVQSLPPVRTEKERIAAGLAAQATTLRMAGERADEAAKSSAPSSAGRADIDERIGLRRER